MPHKELTKQAKDLIFYHNFLLRGGKGFSLEAQTVFALMDSDPTPELKVLMAAFIDSQVVSGNWPKLTPPTAPGLMDCFQFYAMDTAANAVINWIGLASTDALLVNSPVFDPFDGITGNGSTSRILTNYTPSVDGVLYLQDDAIMGVWCVDNLNGVTGKYLFGSNAANDVWMVQLDNPLVQHRVNSATNTTTVSNLFLDNTLYSVKRVDSANQIGIEGTSETSGAVASTGLPTADLFVLSRSPTAAAHINAKVACFYAGAGIGFDVTNFESNLSTFITATAALG